MSRKSEAEKRAPRVIREDLVSQACLEVYGQVRHEGRLADRALDFTLRNKRNLYSQERRTIAERVYALLRQQRSVDYLLQESHPSWATTPVTRQDLLRLCASRLLEGDSISDVIQAAGLGDPDRQTLQRLPESARKLEGLPREERFPIVSSLPDFLAQEFLQDFGDDAETVAAALNERAPLVVRTNLLKTTREQLLQRLGIDGIEAHATPLSPLGVRLETRINAFSLEAFREGLFEIQDEGSQILGMLVDAPPTQVVDACAGAGGKTLQLAAQMKNRGELHAMDIDARRLEELKRRARRDGVHNVRIQTLPKEGEGDVLAVLEKQLGKMDRVLVDAPCSGTGALRRKPDARYRLKEEDLAMHAARQLTLLGRFAALVKPKGLLVYGTCSVLRRENEHVVELFLTQHPEFQRRPVSLKLPPELAEKVSQDGYLKLLPNLHGTDGFFGTLLERTA